MEFSNDPGDLGRRVADRRRQLGLSRAQVARRARMTEAYVRYVEEQPAEVVPGALWRLAAALETTPRQLLGAGGSTRVVEQQDQAQAILGR